jgi:lipopolysaccharide/colanic/teichoic acid biosynthesis glycosyltransferase
LPRIAAFLRHRHLDELPQLLHVPTGRMSLVGPRPEMTRLHETADAFIAEARVQVRPGCAGLWQVSDGARLLIWDAPHYDLYYVRYASFRLDLWILWRAALHVMGLGRPVTLSDVPRWARGPQLVQPDDRFVVPFVLPDGDERSVGALAN